MSNSHREEPSIITVQDFLSMENVVIPGYQRPYKWSDRNVQALIDDILSNQERSAYRLGTLVFHNDGKCYNIVDGQQRSVTLTLLAMAMMQDARLSKCMKEVWPTIPGSFSLSSERFEHSISRINVRRNYESIKERLDEFADERIIEFFLHKCQFVKVVLSDVSEAFQFFDSQNARGKDLEPHDLLKAFHLREMRTDAPWSVLEAVTGWEGVETEELSRLFGDWLYRVRNWSRQKHARQFSKDDVDVFKGVNPDDASVFPYEQIYRMAHYCVGGFNQSSYSRILNDKMKFPFQLDQIVVNGRRFFEMIDHYNCKRKELKTVLSGCEQVKDIVDALETYDGRNRDGDKYVRNMFDCACFYFWDKFGLVKEFPLVVRRVFYWAYHLRLTYQKLSMPSVDNYALRGDGMMLRIRQAMRPAELISVPSLFVDRVSSTRTGKIEDVFRAGGMLK